MRRRSKDCEDDKSTNRFLLSVLCFLLKVTCLRNCCRVWFSMSQIKIIDVDFVRQLSFMETQ